MWTRRWNTPHPWVRMCFSSSESHDLTKDLDRGICSPLNQKMMIMQIRNHISLIMLLGFWSFVVYMRSSRSVFFKRHFLHFFLLLKLMSKSLIQNFREQVILPMGIPFYKKWSWDTLNCWEQLREMLMMWWMVVSNASHLYMGDEAAAMVQNPSQHYRL